MAKKKLYLIPFDDKGNQMHYADPFVHLSGHTDSNDWREPFEFEATICFQGYRRGRSAAYFLFKDQHTGVEYTMFLTDMEATISHMVRGSVNGRWGFVKRGMNYGISLIEALG